MGLFKAMGFLSILPLPRAMTQDVDFAGAMTYFPLVGALLGAVLALLNLLVRNVWSTTATATVMIVALVVLTGGLHLDGLADTADGLLSGKGREAKLLIMEQSQIGTFGTLAVLCCLLLKVGFLNELPAPAKGRGLILTVALGRWAMVSAAMFFPLAKDKGMGWAFKIHLKGMDFAVATSLTLGLAALLFPPWGLAVCGILWLATLVLGWVITGALGGMTGDTYGATCEISEVLALGMLSLVTGGGG